MATAILDVVTRATGLPPATPVVVVQTAVVRAVDGREALVGATMVVGVVARHRAGAASRPSKATVVPSRLPIPLTDARPSRREATLRVAPALDVASTPGPKVVAGALAVGPVPAGIRGVPASRAVGTMAILGDAGGGAATAPGAWTTSEARILRDPVRARPRVLSVRSIREAIRVALRTSIHSLLKFCYPSS